MWPIATRRLLRRLRSRAVGVALVVALAGAIVVHHTEPTGMMGSGHDDAFYAAMEMCLGAFVSVGTAVAAVALGAVRLGPGSRWRAPRPPGKPCWPTCRWRCREPGRACST